MRARYPDLEGFVECDGVKIGYEVFGEGDTTIMLLPTWTIVHSRFWKMQVPYLARHFRVVTFDGPGNGRSDRPTDPSAYGAEAVARAAIAVLDATGTGRAFLVSLSKGVLWGMQLAAEHPDRVLGAVFIGAAAPATAAHEERTAALEHFFDPAPENPQGWEHLNVNVWLERYRDFLEFFFASSFSEPHSTKQREDCVGWGLETTPEVLLADGLGWDDATLLSVASRVSVPTLFIHGDDDGIAPLAAGEALARATGGEFVVFEGGGHIPNARDPVRVNLLIREFVERVVGTAQPSRRWTRSRHRRRRVLYLSSPIGLGHARRDVAIASELRRQVSDVEIEWLAQHPVTRVLADVGEFVHPASNDLASESAHIESACGEHDLHCFQAWRDMDEILVSDFMVFHDLVTSRDYDLVVADEGWDIDYYLHENPELKQFAYCWLTDFVGWLPMADGGEHEAMLTADYNAEMIEHIARHPRVRDRAIFIGAPDDIVPDRFGPDLPAIRDWTEHNYDFSGDYITGFAPHDIDRTALRASLGFRDDEQVCVVSVGGSGVGTALLQRMIDAYSPAARAVDGLRMIVIAGPRIDPSSLDAPPGVEVHSYVSELYRYFAACDLAVVQGGLTTTMELTATNTPFLYFPLGHHFEQRFHVPQRLARYGAGRQMEFATADPDAIADAIKSEIGRSVRYRPLDPLATGRVASRLAEML